VAVGARPLEAVNSCGGDRPASSRPRPSSLPFFIEWGHGTPLPGHAPATHPAGVVQIAELQLGGDAERLAAWLGAHHLPITVRPDTPALSRITLTASTGEIVLEAE